MKIITSCSQIKMCIQNIFCHIVRIAWSKSNSIKSFYLIKSFKELSERRFSKSIIPFTFFFIPMLFVNKLLSVRINILSNQSYFFCSSFYCFFCFLYYFFYWSTVLWTSCIRHNTKCTIIITSSLYNYCGWRWIFSQLFWF